MSTDGRLIKTNRAWERILGFDPTRIEGRPLHDFVHPEDRAQVREALQKAVGGSTVERIESRFLTHDEENRWMAWSAVCDPDSDRMLGIAHDITTTKEADERVRRTEARSQAIVEGANEAIISFDRDQVITYVNPAAERMFRAEAERLVDSKFTQVLPEERRDAYMADMRRYAESGESPIVGPTVEFEGLRADGTVFPIELSISHWQGLEEDRFTAIIRDITARKEAEEAMRQASEKMRRSNQELEQFAYVASHDLQEPLGIVRSYVQLVRRRLDPASDPQLEKYIDYITDGTERMQLLIQNLLEYSRVETRGRSFTSVATNEVVQEALERVEERLKESDGKVIVEDLPSVDADEDQLVRVFHGLLVNAIEYRGDRPLVIEIWSEPAEDPDMVEFHVRDTGIGIDPEHHERVFQIFQRLHGRSEEGGTGIGLAICKKIVERHGGDIGVDSRTGHGATFWFTMPLAEPVREP